MRREDLVVLCYHGLSDVWPDETAVTPADFEAQVKLFLRRGYRGATFTEAVTGPPRRAVVVTFDDASTSVQRFAAPVLDRLGVPGTIFVPSDYPDSSRPMSWPALDRWLGTEHEHELDCMGWAALGELAERGWEIGAHTCTHPHLEDLGDPDLERELRESKRVCEERLGRPCRSLAYPFGNSDPRVAAAAAAAGYEAAATVPIVAVPPQPLLWPRVGVYRGDSARRVWLRARRRSLGLRPGVEPAISAAQRLIKR